MKSWLSLICVVSLICIFGPGCAKRPRPAIPNLGGPTGVISFDHEAIFQLGTAFVVWTDGTGGGGGSEYSDDKGTRCHGHLQAGGGKVFQFHCETKDGQTGKVTVAGKDYDLAEGNLFLVRAEGDQFVIKQLKRDLLDVKFERESLQAFERNDPEISGFFAKAAPPPK
jgi:hypothetical protein